MILVFDVRLFRWYLVLIFKFFNASVHAFEHVVCVMFDHHVSAFCCIAILFCNFFDLVDFVGFKVDLMLELCYGVMEAFDFIMEIVYLCFILVYDVCFLLEEGGFDEFDIF